jgi:hypothetical protein
MSIKIIIVNKKSTFDEYRIIDKAKYFPRQFKNCNPNLSCLLFYQISFGTLIHYQPLA